MPQSIKRDCPLSPRLNYPSHLESGIYRFFSEWLVIFRSTSDATAIQIVA
jgi:hypothetical protein